jgi:hypothetical protein
MRDPATETLDYVVPEGQDPAVIRAALSKEGYDANLDPRSGDQLLHIEYRGGGDRDRARVRAIIESVDTSAIDAGVPVEWAPVRFADEDA